MMNDALFQASNTTLQSWEAPKSVFSWKKKESHKHPPMMAWGGVNHGIIFIYGY